MQEIIEVQKQNKNIKPIDYNCDLAQCFGIYKQENEFDLLDYVSSVNIATGFHAGDPIAIKNALLNVREKNVVVGAHIGFNDIQGFGAREMLLKDDEIESIVVYQVGALISFAKAYGLEIEHVRPHGAMYKMAGENFQFACAIAKAIKKCSQWLTYVGPAGDITEKAGEHVKLPVAQEIKLSKVYNSDGTIDYSSAEITDTEMLTRRILGLVKSSQISNNINGFTAVNVDTIHFTLTNDKINSVELIKKACEIMMPRPINFSKAEKSGWV